MENAKNSFYIAVRNRLAALNPARTLTIGGVIRPGILVEENELPAARPPLDVFVMRWIRATVNLSLPLPLVELTCEVHYATCGTTGNAGVDRGRMLAAMDAELLALLAPYSTLKLNYAQVPPVSMGTTVFWTEAVFQPAIAKQDGLSRSATVQVFTYQEPGER